MRGRKFSGTWTVAGTAARKGRLKYIPRRGGVRLSRVTIHAEGGGGNGSSAASLMPAESPSRSFLKLYGGESLACSRQQIPVLVYTMLYVHGGCRGPSLLLQQGGDVDVPTNGLPVKATGEEVAGLILLVPRRAAHHPPVTLQKNIFGVEFG